jgi:hypothetical protein
MARVAEEDRRRLIESRRDLDRTEAVERLTTHEDYQRALSASHGELGAARASLVEAARAAAREAVETQEANVALLALRRQVEESYGYLRKVVEGALLRHNPRRPRAEAEVTQRQRLFGRVFGDTQSALQGRSHDQLLERAVEVQHSLESEALLAALRDEDGELLSAYMSKEVEGLGAALRTWQREVGEEREAFVALRAARAALEVSLSSHAEQVTSVLRRQGRLAEQGQFLVAHDPAWQARRRAGAPIEDESDSPALDTELNLPTDPT